MKILALLTCLASFVFAKHINPFFSIKSPKEVVSIQVAQDKLYVARHDGKILVYSLAGLKKTSSKLGIVEEIEISSFKDFFNNLQFSKIFSIIVLESQVVIN